jgi:hypothetical protein
MKFVQYTNDYLGLLEKYFNNPNTPLNNNSHKAFKTHLYNGDTGILGMLIDNEEIVAVSSAVVVIENGILSCKYPHRLHVRSDYSYMTSKFIDQHWDPMLFDWLYEKNIKNVYCTFNIDNPKAFLWACKRHSRRIKNNSNINKFGKTILNKKWYVYNAIVDEMYTPQYLLYSSPTDDWFFPWRTEHKISDEVKHILDQTFEYTTSRGWII